MKQLVINLKNKKAFKIFETLEALNVITVERKTQKIESEKQKQRRKIILAFKEVALIQAGKSKGIPLKDFIAELNEI